MGDEQDVPAGAFSTWVEELATGQAGGSGVDVPCGPCTACCRSSYFVHIGPEETDTLRRIPAELLFPAPGRPKGTVVLGYDERGHCPLLVDDRCSIYEHRPRACRAYDCRVFAAAGVSPLDDGKPSIAVQVRRWRFDVSTVGDEVRRAAVGAAARFLVRRPECVPGGTAPASASQLALLAVKAHGAFLSEGGDTGEVGLVDPDIDAVRAELQR